MIEFSKVKNRYINHERKIGNKFNLHYSYILTILSADFGAGYMGQCPKFPLRVRASCITLRRLFSITVYPGDVFFHFTD